MGDNTEYLSNHLSADFLQILTDKKMKQGEKIEALIDAVDYLLENRLAGVSFRRTNVGIERIERNDGDLEIFTDAHGNIEHIDFLEDERVADLHFR